jgi:hypothetical protein
MLCIPVENSRRFGRIYYLCLQVENKQAIIKEGFILASGYVCEISLFGSITTSRNMDTPYVRRFLQHISVHCAIIKYLTCSHTNTGVGEQVKYLMMAQ